MAEVRKKKKRLKEEGKWIGSVRLIVAPEIRPGYKNNVVASQNYGADAIYSKLFTRHQIRLDPFSLMSSR